MHRIGFLGVTSAADTETRLDALRAGLRKLGYVEGKNIAIEYRFAEGKYERLAALATELVSLKVDVIVTYSNLGARAAKQATATIPIVVAVSADLVSKGLVSSLARPGGNVTGSSIFTLELGQKRLEMLKEAMPRIKRVAYLMNPGSDVADSNLRAILVAARTLKLEVQLFEVQSPDQFDGTFAEMGKQHIAAVLIQEEPMIVSNANSVASSAARHRLPSIGFAALAEAGGLIGYGASSADMFRRAAVFVDKILKGTKPGDLPIEQAMTFELVINRKAAKALGLTIPQSVLARADKVIE
jgi:putative ABC transport system substrate-binding protein